MNKYYIVALRNIQDGYIKSVNIVPSLNSYIGEIKAFIRSNPSNALALFASDWEIAYKTIDLADPDWVNDMTTMSIASWEPLGKDGE